MGHLNGGTWNGLIVVTKASGFRKEDVLEEIVDTLLRGTC